MASGNKTIGFNADESVREAVETYRERHGHGTRADALEELVEIGLNEARSPIMYRMKDLAIEASVYLFLGAVVATTIGFTTTALAPSSGLQVAAAFLAASGGVLGAAELARTVGGHGELGSLLRGVRR